MNKFHHKIAAGFRRHWASAAIAAAAAVLLAFLLWPHPPAPAPREEKPLPALLSDEAFLAALDRIGTRGRAGIAVVAPASGLKGENVPRAYAMAEKLGVSLSREALAPEDAPYHAAADETRLRLFLQALNDPGVEVLWAVRGGYGASRLLPALANAPLPETPKVLVGYSDITFLHLFLGKRGWPSVHGAMFWELDADSRDPENFRRLAALLSGETSELRYEGLKPANPAAEKLDRPVAGRLVGGNLTCLAAAIGTPWQPDASGNILFLEDVKEKGYKLDRMFVQLQQAGVLDGVSAILLGEFSEGDEQVEFALARFARSVPAPVFRCDWFGHGGKNYPLILNAPAVIAAEGAGFVIGIDNILPTRHSRRP